MLTDLVLLAGGMLIFGLSIWAMGLFIFMTGSPKEERK